MTFQTVTDYDIQALIDNELGHEKAKQVLKHVKNNPHAQQRYKAMKTQKNLLKLWWKSQQN